MKRSLGFPYSGTFMVLVVTGAVLADEEKVALDKLPKAVLETVKAKFPDADLRGAAKESENNKTVYEVNLKFKGHVHDVIVTPEGKIELVEKEIEAKDLPKAVSEALAGKYPKAAIKRAEEISKDDKVTAFEMLIVTEGKKTLEVKFAPDGKLLEEEEKKAGDKD